MCILSLYQGFYYDPADADPFLFGLTVEAETMRDAALKIVNLCSDQQINKVLYDTGTHEHDGYCKIAYPSVRFEFQSKKRNKPYYHFYYAIPNDLQLPTELTIFPKLAALALNLKH